MSKTQKNINRRERQENRKGKKRIEKHVQVSLESTLCVFAKLLCAYFWFSVPLLKGHSREGLFFSSVCALVSIWVAVQKAQHRARRNILS